MPGKEKKKRKKTNNYVEKKTSQIFRFYKLIITISFFLAGVYYKTQNFPRFLR